MQKHIRFHHYGLAIRKFENAKIFHQNLGYSIGKVIFDRLQNVELLLCTSEIFPNVELVKPANGKNPINNFLNKNNEMIYHVCYEVDVKKISLNEFFSKNRYICVSKPKPAVLFNNRNVSFYYLNNVGLIEILEK
jgi:methylmalonyl-CoA/ethylmalonyl-CoA epimerase